MQFCISFAASRSFGAAFFVLRNFHHGDTEKGEPYLIAGIGKGRNLPLIYTDKTDQEEVGTSGDRVIGRSGDREIGKNKNLPLINTDNSDRKTFPWINAGERRSGPD
jgi:hypothetical protein